jgi:quercetin dioxygenase-like cupin family protein
MLFLNYRELTARKPDSEGPTVKVWNIRQNETIRINLVEMCGELKLHQHPDAEHSLMLIEGKVRALVGDQEVILEKGDFLSIPPSVPHKYWSLDPRSLLVSMDAPYYDPKRTVVLE